MQVHSAVTLACRDVALRPPSAVRYTRRMPDEELAAAFAKLLAAVAAQPPPPPTPELLTVAEASEKLRVCESTVYAMIREGRLRVVKIGRRRFVPSDQVAAIIRGTA